MTALVLHPEGANFAAVCTRVTVMALSSVQEAPVHVDVNAPGKKIGGVVRGLEDNAASPLMVTEFTAQRVEMHAVPVASGKRKVRFAVSGAGTPVLTVNPEVSRC